MGNTKAKNNSNKPKQTAKTVTSVKKQNTVEYVIVNIPVYRFYIQNEKAL